MKEKILVVDDDKSMVNMIKDVLDLWNICYDCI